MRRRWTLHYHPGVTSFLYSLREQVSVVTAVLWPLQENPTPETARPVPGRPGRYQIDLEGFVIQYEVLPDQHIVKVVLVERT
jgi:hypothetical protein